ncbi:MAG: hypothetical protein Q7K43_06300 [Candidatus Woesearchaeota archaeon]|nr:hypothetical protein [Candidatus Woesearchaeota archaeon]
MTLEQLHKALKKFKNEKNLFDILLYGSTAQNSPNPKDTDILVIFKTGSLKERLDCVQRIKKNISSEHNLDIQTVLLEELFSPNFFAKTGVFIDGISIIDNKPFCHKSGFVSNTIFVFDLKNKTHAQKVKFNYLLAGRTTPGILKHLKGIRLAAGVIQVHSHNAREFEEILLKNAIQHTRKNVLVQE